MKAIWSTVIVAVAASVLAVACCRATEPLFSEPFLSVDDYDRSCDSVDDCYLVADGDQCDVCGPCDDSGINQIEAKRWRADRGKIECGPPPQADCEPCPRVELVCESGVCDARPVKTDP